MTANINDKYIPLWEKLKNNEVFDPTIRGKSWSDLTESNKEALCFIFNYSYGFNEVVGPLHLLYEQR